MHRERAAINEKDYQYQGDCAPENEQHNHWRHPRHIHLDGFLSWSREFVARSVPTGPSAEGAVFAGIIARICPLNTSYTRFSLSHQTAGKRKIKSKDADVTDAHGSIGLGQHLS